MDTARRFAKNTGVLFTSQILSYILSFFYVFYVVRYLGAENFGILSFAISFATIFGIVSDLGLSIFITREISRDTSSVNKYLDNAIAIKLLLTVLTLVLIFLTINLFNYPAQTKLIVYIIGLSIIINYYSQILFAVFQAYEKMEYQSLGTILTNLILLVGSLIAVEYNYSLTIFALIYLISNIIVLLYALIICILKFTVPKIKRNYNFWKEILREAIPFGLTTMSGTLYTYVDSILLSLIQGNEVVGWYSAAYRIMLLALFIPISINYAIFPIMSKLYSDSSKETLRIIYEKYFKFMLIVGIPLGAGTTVLANKIVLIILGQGYEQSVIALQILIWTMVFTFAAASFVQVLQAVNKQTAITKISIICLIINIILNLIVIPKYSYIGASYVTLITEIILVSYIFFISSKLGYGINLKSTIKNLLKVSFASVVMIIFFIYFYQLNLILLVGAGLIIYLIVLYLIRGINNSDLKIFKMILKRN